MLRLYRGNALSGLCQVIRLFQITSLFLLKFAFQNLLGNQEEKKPPMKNQLFSWLLFSFSCLVGLPHQGTVMQNKEPTWNGLLLTRNTEIIFQFGIILISYGVNVLNHYIIWLHTIQGKYCYS